MGSHIDENKFQLDKKKTVNGKSQKKSETFEKKWDQHHQNGFLSSEWPVYLH